MRMVYLFEMGLSLYAMASLGFCVPVLFVIILSRERGMRGGSKSGYCESYIDQNGREVM